MTAIISASQVSGEYEGRSIEPADEVSSIIFRLIRQLLDARQTLIYFDFCLI